MKIINLIFSEVAAVNCRNLTAPASFMRADKAGGDAGFYLKS